MEFRLGERWEVLDDSIPAGETELLARDLIQVKHTDLYGLLPLHAGLYQTRNYPALLKSLSHIKMKEKEKHSETLLLLC